MNRFFLLFLLLPLSLFAEEERIPYTCDNGSRLEIVYSVAADGRPQAVLYFSDSTVTLPQVVAASGALYKQDNISLHTKGDEAYFEDGAGNVRHCSRGTALLTKSPPPLTSSFIDVVGSATYLTRMALPPDAVLKLRVHDQSPRGKRTLAEQSIPLAGAQVPIPFQMTIDRDLLGKKPRLSLSARIERAGKILFVNAKATAVPIGGEPVEIQLRPVSTSRKKS